MTTSADHDHLQCELLAAFAAYEKSVLGLSPKTLRNHGIYLRAYANWWLATHPGRPLCEARTGDVAQVMIAEADRGIGARPRRSQLGTLRGFYEWLVLTDRASLNPALLVPSPRVQAPTLTVYSSSQISSILRHTAGLDDIRGRQRHAIVSTLRYTGKRSGELRHLRLRDLDLTEGRATVTGKAGRQRVVLLPPQLVPILDHFLSAVRPRLPASPLLLANAHPFVTTPQHGFGTDALCREVELAGLGAGVPGRHHPHKWRHTFATELVRGGVDIHVVQRLLGHTTIASTVGYTHLALDDLRDAVSRVWEER